MVPATSHRSELDELKGEVQRLRLRVEQLENAQSAPKSSADQGYESYEDPFANWILTHQAILAEHAGQHLAIHATKGVLFSSADDEVFERWLSGVSDDDAHEILVTHASLYV